MHVHMRNLLVMAALLGVMACNGKKDGTTPRPGKEDTGDSTTPPDMTGKARPVKQLSQAAKEAFKAASRNVQDVIKDVAGRGGKWSPGDCERAAEAFSKVAEQTAGEQDAVARARFNEGVAWSKCHMDEKASAAYRAALAANPRYAPAKVNMAEMHARQGNTTAAWDTFLQAFLAAPEDNDTNYNMAVLLEQMEQQGKAPPASLINFWRKLKFDPKTAGDVAELHLRMVLAKSSAGATVRDATLNLKAYTLMALLYFNQSAHRKHRSKLTLASLVLKEALKVLDRESVKGNYCKDPEKATYFDMAVAQLRNLTGLILLRREELVDAMYRFEAAIQCNADFIEAHMNRAAIALGFRGYWIAHDSLQRVLKLEPNNLDATIGLGVAYRGIATDLDPRGKEKSREDWYKLAVGQYEKALKMNPNNTDPIYNLGHLYMDHMNDIDQAEKWFKEYLSKPTRITPADARREVSAQIEEIAHQREIGKKMDEMKNKQEEMKRKREADEARRKAEEAASPMKEGPAKEAPAPDMAPAPM